MAIVNESGGGMSFTGRSISRAMRRRLIELFGLGCLALGLALGLALASYSASDPSYFIATPRAPQNWLGHAGAFVADPMMRAFGLGGWAFVALCTVWGWRAALHRRETLIWRRLPAIPVAVVLASVFASVHVPWAGWPLPTGLGGWLGDTGVALAMRLVPMPADAALKALSLGLLALLTVASVLALGVSGDELSRFLRWLWRSALAVTAALWHGLVALLAALAGVVRGWIAHARGLDRPRSERLDPAEPTGSWRRRVPGLAKAASVNQRVADMAANVPPGLPADLRGAFEGETQDLKALGIDPDLPPEAALSMTAGRVEPTFGGEARSGVAGADGPPEPYSGVENALSAAMRALSADERGAGAERDLPLNILDEAPEADDDAGLTRAPVARPKAATRISKRARTEREPELFDAGGDAEYSFPPLGLLQKPVNIRRAQMSDSALEDNARMLETVLEDYGVRGEIVAVKPGPVVTLYELEPAPGLKASRVIGLADDIARSMSALAARVSTMPGRSVIGIELPNETRETVYLRETLESPSYGDSRHPLALALGKDIEGRPVVANLAKMPHLLIAGTTGSGKSVAINTMILSLLYRLTPNQCRLIMIDPKMLELSVYDNIPHLLAPVVTDPKKALVALKWVVAEMEERYRKMSKLGVRNIDGFNARVREALKKGEDFSRVVQTGFDEATGEPVYETETFEPEEMPFIVVIVDEMADLMMVAGKEIEACIQRLAQMARASGIHLIMATQRPSVDVITGTIKANFPTRISFQVTSKIDSRTILGEQGAEQLLGQGDMLYMAGGGRITRVHGPFVTDEEVEEVVRHLKALGQPDYVRAVTEGGDEETQALVDEKLGLAQPGDSADELYDRAVAIVARDRKCSTSYIQRKLAIGYNKAARLVEQMEEEGVVSAANAVGKRDILIEER